MHTLTDDRTVPATENKRLSAALAWCERRRLERDLMTPPHRFKLYIYPFGTHQSRAIKNQTLLLHTPRAPKIREGAKSFLIMLSIFAFAPETYSAWEKVCLRDTVVSGEVIYKEEYDGIQELINLNIPAPADGVISSNWHNDSCKNYEAYQLAL